MVGKDNAGLGGRNSLEPNRSVFLRLDFDEPATFGNLPVQSGGSRGACGDEAGEEDNVRKDPCAL